MAEPTHPRSAPAAQLYPSRRTGGEWRSAHWRAIRNGFPVSVPYRYRAKERTEEQVIADAEIERAYRNGEEWTQTGRVCNYKAA